MKELEYRFSEIVTTIALLEDTEFSDIEAEVLILPNLTKGLDDMNLINALCVQSSKETDDWRMKFYTALIRSAMQHVMDSEEVNTADLNAFALAANVAWASGSGHAVFRALGLLSHTAEACKAEIPEFAYTVLQDPSGVIEWSATLDPYAVLEGRQPEIPFTRKSD
jgi:hypothetical protein